MVFGIDLAFPGLLGHQLSLGHAGRLGELGRVGVDLEVPAAPGGLPSISYVQRNAEPCQAGKPRQRQVSRRCGPAPESCRRRAYRDGLGRRGLRSPRLSPGLRPSDSRRLTRCTCRRGPCRTRRGHPRPERWPLRRWACPPGGRSGPGSKACRRPGRDVAKISVTSERKPQRGACEHGMSFQLARQLQAGSQKRRRKSGEGCLRQSLNGILLMGGRPCRGLPPIRPGPWLQPAVAFILANSDARVATIVVNACEGMPWVGLPAHSRFAVLGMLGRATADGRAGLTRPSRSNSTATSGRFFRTGAISATVPTRAKRKADLRLDQEVVGQVRSRRPARDRAGRRKRQRVYRRITAEAMRASGCRRRSRESRSSAAEIERSAAGSTREQSGSRTGRSSPPQDRECPQSVTASRVRNPIDAFIQARLESEGLEPSAEAERGHLDQAGDARSHGLPPDARRSTRLRRDASPDAYEKVRRSLAGFASVGERLATRWLNAARYADTNGYQTDGARDHVAVARLGDRCVQPQSAVRPVHDRAARRRHAAVADARPEDRDRVQSQPSRQRRRRDHPRGVRRRIRRRPRRYNRDGLAGPDARLRPLPQPQVRPDRARGVL